MAFVEAVGVTAGSAALLATGVSAAVAANDKIRLGIIGAGNRGMSVLDTFLTHPEVDCIAVADVDDKHATECAESVEKKRGHKPSTSRDLTGEAPILVARGAEARWVGPTEVGSISSQFGI
jgi:ornithine cyclodeaminase/alanine dehydrogenase-like protein (mu-crystallin family)